jgi:phage gpG-like protein
LVGSEQIITRLDRVYPAVRSRLDDAVARMAFKLEEHIKRNKLSGQVLGKYTHWKATNRLRNSINVARWSDMGGTAIMASVGTNVEYGAFWEYGFTGQISVKAHQRKMTQAFGRPLRSPVTASVRGFSRTVNVAPRSFLRSALADLQAEIKAAISQAVSEGAKA